VSRLSVDTRVVALSRVAIRPRLSAADLRQLVGVEPDATALRALVDLDRGRGREPAAQHHDLGMARAGL
jgi:hypothetical protein